MSHRLQRLTLKPEQYHGYPESAQVLFLLPEQQRYLLRALRLKAGDKFIAIIPQEQVAIQCSDDFCSWWEAEILNDEQFQLVMPLANDRELSINLKLAIGMPKGNGLEDIIRQGTEIGVHEIYPLYTERTLLKPNTPPSNGKQDRWQRIAEEAAELACRPVVPVVHRPQSYGDWLKNYGTNSDTDSNTDSDLVLMERHLNLICVTHEAPHLLSIMGSRIMEPDANYHPDHEYKRIDSITVLIGPEGGWTATEEAAAMAQGFVAVSLGKRILAAVTAPLVALSLISAAWEGLPSDLK